MNFSSFIHFNVFRLHFRFHSVDGPFFSHYTHFSCIICALHSTLYECSNNNNKSTRNYNIIHKLYGFKTTSLNHFILTIRILILRIMHVVLLWVRTLHGSLLLLPLSTCTRSLCVCVCPVFVWPGQGSNPIPAGLYCIGFECGYSEIPGLAG